VQHTPCSCDHHLPLRDVSAAAEQERYRNTTTCTLHRNGK
jgi:hypothetical protein